MRGVQAGLRRSKCSWERGQRDLWQRRAHHHLQTLPLSLAQDRWAPLLAGLAPQSQSCPRRSIRLPGCLVALNEPCTPAGPGKTSCCFTVQAPAWVLIGLASIKAPNT